MSKHNSTPFIVRFSISAANFIGQTAGVADEAKTCAQLEYHCSKEEANQASQKRLDAFKTMRIAQYKATIRRNR